MIGVCIFDFDGTLVDTVHDVVDSLKSAFEACGVEPAALEPETILQLQLKEAIESAAPGITPEQTARVLAGFKKVYDSTDYPRTTLMPTAAELLPRLRERSTGMFIVTNKRRVPTLRILDKFTIGPYFTAVYNPDMYGGEKRMTKIELLAHAMENHSIPRETAVYIGDTEADVVAAKENGVTSVIVTNGYGTAGAFRVCPDRRIDRLIDILEL